MQGPRVGRWPFAAVGLLKILHNVPVRPVLLMHALHERWVPRSWTGGGSLPHKAPMADSLQWSEHLPLDELAMAAADALETDAVVILRFRSTRFFVSIGTWDISLPVLPFFWKLNIEWSTHWFYIFWHSGNSDVFNLIAYWVCSAPRTKSQSHIFVNWQLKWNSKSVRIKSVWNISTEIVRKFVCDERKNQDNPLFDWIEQMLVDPQKIVFIEHQSSRAQGLYSKFQLTRFIILR